MSHVRRLAAILAADVAGYSRLMGADEEGTLERLKSAAPRVPRSEDGQASRPHRQDHTGDGMLTEFRASSMLCAAAFKTDSLGTALQAAL
jgi:class 3 adenylate cyclase